MQIIVGVKLPGASTEPLIARASHPARSTRRLIECQPIGIMADRAGKADAPHAITLIMRGAADSLLRIGLYTAIATTTIMFGQAALAYAVWASFAIGLVK